MAGHTLARFSGGHSLKTLLKYCDPALANTRVHHRGNNLVSRVAHPGMTVVECAAMGAPSVINHGGAVGAGDLLDERAGEVIALDLAAPVSQVAAAVHGLLLDRDRLAAVGARAARKARSWTGSANAAKLVEIVETARARSDS